MTRVSSRLARAAACAGLSLGLCAASAAAARAETETANRYASLRHETTHARAGPGQDYPIRWTYKRKGLPVLVLREYDLWRQVRDPEGDEGWVHAAGVTRRRTVMVTGQARILRKDPQDSGAPVARLEPGVIGRIERCDRAWCRITVTGYSGWLKHGEVWGVRPGETVE